MSKWRVEYGDPGGLETTHIEGDAIDIRQIDSEGTRRLEVWEESGDDETETVAEITVGPGHLLGYEKR